MFLKFLYTHILTLHVILFFSFYHVLFPSLSVPDPDPYMQWPSSPVIPLASWPLHAIIAFIHVKQSFILHVPSQGVIDCSLYLPTPTVSNVLPSPVLHSVLCTYWKSDSSHTPLWAHFSNWNTQPLAIFSFKLAFPPSSFPTSLQASFQTGPHVEPRHFLSIFSLFLK